MVQQAGFACRAVGEGAVLLDNKLVITLVTPIEKCG